MQAWGSALPNPLAIGRFSYPIDRFPGLAGSLVRDLTASGAIAPEIVGSVAMTAMSLTTQSQADVLWPNGQPASIGTNAIVVSPSGSGKTVAYNWFMQPIEKYLEQLTAADPEGGHGGLLLEDLTRPEIVSSLKDWPAAGLFTDEGGIAKRLLKDSTTLVKLLDGTTLRSARVSTGRVALAGHRLCMLLMQQPDVFEETKPLLGGRKGSVGMANRFFVARSVESAEGSTHNFRSSDHLALAYKKRTHKLLDALVARIKEGNQARPALKLSASANKCLTEITEDARQRRSEPNSPWADISEYIRRHAERVLRLAGVFHVFEYGPEGEISLDTLERAESFGNWYVDSYREIFCEEPKPTQAEIGADALWGAFVSICQTTSRWTIPQSELRTWAINLGLTGSRFTRALAVLCKQGRVGVFPGRNGPQIGLNGSSLLPSYR